MKILYLIGNGLDIAQGMNTRYSDFYDKYSKPYNLELSPAALRLRNEIGKDYQTWADLEYRLGEYTSQIKKDGFDDVYYDISDALRDYLLEEQAKYKATVQNKESAIKDLINPYSTLLERDKKEVQAFIDKQSTHPPTGTHIDAVIDIISFNYTNTLQQLLSEHLGVVIGKINYRNAYLRNIIHIHGTLDSHMIMGVNDISQINNEEFKKDSDVCDMIVKPQSNNAIRSNNDILCNNLIDNADMIVIFGMSLGATDKTWWQRIGEKLLRGNTKLIIFEHISQPIDHRRAHKLGKMRQTVIEKFTSHLKLDPPLLSHIEKNTYVNFSTDFLSINKDIEIAQ